MNHRTRTSKNSSATQRAMRIGIVQRGHLIEEKRVTDCPRITIGQSPRNLFTLSASGLPRTYQIFHREGGRHVLRFAPGMDGRITVDGRLWTLSQACDAGAARRVGDWYELRLQPGARGKLSLGEITVLFQQLELAPSVPQPRLPASLQGGIASRVDPTFSMFLSGSLALAAAFLIAVQLVPKPTGTIRSSRIKTLLNNEARIERSQPNRPKPGAVIQKPQKGEPGDDPTATPSDVAPTRRQANWRNTRQANPAQKYKKGTAEYRAALASLTDVGITDGRMTINAITAQCRTAAECERAVVGRDPLRNGGSFSDLDDRAQRPGGVTTTRPTGPSTHTRRTTLVNNGGRPVVTGTRTNPTATTKPQRQPVKLKQPKGMHIFQAPKTRPKGGASISAKVRSRVYSLRYCYNRLLPSHPTLKGSVKISFVVLPNGRVKSVNITTGMGGSMKSCVRNKVASWTLGKPKISGPVYYGPFTVRFHARN